MFFLSLLAIPSLASKYKVTALFKSCPAYLWQSDFHGCVPSMAFSAKLGILMADVVDNLTMACNIKRTVYSACKIYAEPAEYALSKLRNSFWTVHASKRSQ